MGKTMDAKTPDEHTSPWDGLSEDEIRQRVQENSIARFRECEAARKAALDAGHNKDAAHDAAKAIWNAWAEAINVRRAALEEAGDWQLDKDNLGYRLGIYTAYANTLSPLMRHWLLEATTDFSFCLFVGQKKQLDKQAKGEMEKSHSDTSEAEVKSLFVESDGVNFSGFIFPGHAYFDDAQFSGDDASFSEAQFIGGTASFSDAKFTSDANFSDASFSGAQFTGGYASFSGVQFSGDANFRNAQFTSDANFRNAQFTGDAWFGDAIFTGDANFRNAQFTGNAWFITAQFSGDANFRDATFTGDANFRNAQFTGGNAWFITAQFSGDATFDDAQFSGDDAWFSGAKFTGGDASFDDAQFTGGNAWFNNAQFTGGDASFFRVRISPEAIINFSKVIFGVEEEPSKSANFGEARFDGPVKFENAIFHGPTSFRSMRSEISFRLENTKFAALPDFREVRIEHRPELDGMTIDDPFQTATIDEKNPFQTETIYETVSEDDPRPAAEAYPRWWRWIEKLPKASMSSMAYAPDPDTVPKYRALRGLAMQANDHELEMDAFANEIRAQRFREHSPFDFREGKAGRFWIGFLYQHISNFGRSFWRPLGLWAGLTLTSFILNFLAYLPGTNAAPGSRQTGDGVSGSIFNIDWPKPPKFPYSENPLDAFMEGTGYAIATAWALISAISSALYQAAGGLIAFAFNMPCQSGPRASRL